MIRFSVVKIGDKLGGKNNSMEKVDGEIPWKLGRSEMDDKSRQDNLSRYGVPPR